MAFDLLLSENGDLVFSAIRDLQGVAGTNEVAQRIRTRLKIPRGTWLYDDDESLGSQLHNLIASNPAEIQTRGEAYVREALRPMDDVSIDNVQVDSDGKNMTVTVEFHVSGEEDESLATDFSAGTVSFAIPEGG